VTIHTTGCTYQQCMYALWVCGEIGAAAARADAYNLPGSPDRRWLVWSNAPVRRDRTRAEHMHGSNQLSLDRLGLDSARSDRTDGSNGTSEIQLDSHLFWIKLNGHHKIIKISR
jgi:hypothetical protein